MIEKEKLLFFSGFTGQLDGIIIYTHRNRRCIRSIPSEIKPPSSPGQLAQQERIAAVAIFYHALKAAGLYTYWQKAAEGLPQTGYNLLVKSNLPAFSGQGTICDFSKIQITEGDVALPDDLQLQASPQGTWILQWGNTPLSPRSKDDDGLWMCVMRDRATFDMIPLDTGGCNRQEGKAIFHIPDILKDYPHLYVVFCSRTSGMCSKSRYFNINLITKNYGYF